MQLPSKQVFTSYGKVAPFHEIFNKSFREKSFFSSRSDENNVKWKTNTTTMCLSWSLSRDNHSNAVCCQTNMTSIQVAFWWFSARHIHIQVSLSYKNIILRHSVRCQMCVLSPVEKLLQPVNFLKWDIELSVLQSETRKNNNN